MHHLHWGLYCIYAVFNDLFVPIIYFLVVETAGRSLEMVDRWFEWNAGWLVHGLDHSPVFERVHEVGLERTAEGAQADRGGEEDENEGMIESLWKGGRKGIGGGEAKAESLDISINLLETRSWSVRRAPIVLDLPRDTTSYASSPLQVWPYRSSRRWAFRSRVGSRVSDTGIYMHGPPERS